MEKGDRKKSAAFTATRLTPTVFKIVEYDDIFSEHPFIYAKVLKDVVVLVDTGCGGRTNDPTVDVKSLREFVETWPIQGNGGKPLNEGGVRDYAVVCTHCHYDHILALDQFSNDSQIFASSHSPDFLSPDNIGRHSFCDRLGVPTPHYKPVLVDHNSFITHSGISTGLQVIHTPGHTPDELALWDETERMLYVGDTVYEWEHIIFPMEGNIADWLTSMDYLIRFVTRVEKDTKVGKNLDSPGAAEVKINAGHVTSMRNALDVLTQARAFIMDVIIGNVPVRSRRESRGVILLEFVREDMRFSMSCPEALLEDVRKKILCSL